MKLNKKPNRLLSAADERDICNARRSGQVTLRILNRVCLAAAIFSLLIYGGTKKVPFLITGLTLVGVICLMFLLVLFTNLYYERKN